MVMLAAGFGGGAALARGLPYAVQMGRQGIASLTALSAEAGEAAAAASRSFMNRLGRLPTAKELVEALGPIKSYQKVPSRIPIQRTTQQARRHRALAPRPRRRKIPKDGR
jgi:hypothetical protein